MPNELNELDWKLDLSDHPNRMIEHLSAFANLSTGGCLVFGINNEAKAVGVNAAQVAALTNQLANFGRDALEPPLALDHAVEDWHGVPLLFVRIPSSNGKPVHKRGKSIEEAWIRSNGSTRKAARAEIAGLMLHSAPPQWEELYASQLMTLEQVRECLDLDAVAKLRERPLPSSDLDLSKWLVEEKLIREESRGYYVTNLGAMACARALDKFEPLARKALRMIRYLGTDKASDTQETKGKRGYAIGFESLITHLQQVLPHSEVIEQALRKRVPLYPEIALRELIANALIHQDFLIKGAGPMIEIFDDRLEISNPGQILPSKKLDRLIGTAPESRNEQLASSFRLYRICEERGTGFQKVIKAVEFYGMPPLLLTSLENGFKVTLFAPKPFSEMTQKDRIEAAYQHAMLQYFSNKKLTNTSLRTRFKLSDKARTQISNLKFFPHFRINPVKSTR